MNHLIWKEEIIYITPKKTGVISTRDITTLSGLEGQSQIGITRIASRIVESPTDDPNEVDRLAIQLLPADYIICWENIGKGLYQIFGVEGDILQKIKETIPPERIETIFPYALAIRNLLEVNNISPEEYTAFLDDTGEGILFTVFHKKRISPVLSISRDKLREDFTRGKEEYTRREKETDIKLNVATNSVELKDRLVKENIASKEIITLIKTPHSIAEGLKKTIPAQFILPEQIRYKQKEKERKRSYYTAMATGFVALVSVVFCSQMYLKRTGLENRLLQLQAEKTTETHKLQETFRAKYRDIILQRQNQYLAPALEKFFKYIPLGFNIKEVKLLENNGDWGLCAYITPKESFTISRKELQKIFPSSSIENSFFGNVAGLQIIYAIDRNGEEVSGSPFRDRWEAGAKK